MLSGHLCLGFHIGHSMERQVPCPKPAVSILWSENCVPACLKRKEGVKAEVGKQRICPLTSELIFCFLPDHVENWAQNSFASQVTKDFM